MKKLTSPFTLIKKSWEIFTKKENFLFLIQVYLPVAILSLISLLFVAIPTLHNFSLTNTGNVVVWAMSFLLTLTTIFVNLCGIIAISNILDGEKFLVKKVFKEAFPKFGIFFLLTIILNLSASLGFILLIVPSVLVITWFAFSKFIMVDKKAGLKKSLIESKNLVKGNFWQVLGRVIVFGLFWLLFRFVIDLFPYSAGSVIFSLCSGLFVIPQILLYREITSE